MSLPFEHAGLVYDAATILGIAEPSSEPLPEPAPGEVVIRVGAWSLNNLRLCTTVVRDNLMWDDPWYEQYDCSNAKLTAGVYRLRMPIPDSSDKNFNEQRALLLSGEEVAPVALAAAALLCHLKETGKALLDDDFTRCAETLPDEDRVGLTVYGGRVFAGSRWDGGRSHYLWLAGCRKS